MCTFVCEVNKADRVVTQLGFELVYVYTLYTRIIIGNGKSEAEDCA